MRKNISALAWSWHFVSVTTLTMLVFFSSCGKRETPAPVADPPLINSFSPTHGIAGDQVVITGSNFSATASTVSVRFSGAAVDATIINTTTTQLTVTVPAGATTGPISVTVSGRTASSTTNFTMEQVVTTVAGSGVSGFADGTGTAAMFSYVTDLVVDATGNIYVADASNFRIRKITAAGVVTTFAGSGNYAFADGTGTNASFGTILGIAIDGSGNLYIGDLGNNRVRKISPAAVVTTIGGGGAGSLPGYVDGPAATSQFHLPMGVAVDNAGNVFVADAGNNCIRKISAAGTVSTIAGNGTAGFVDATGTAARFNNPIRVKMDANGNLFVADQNNHRVRKINAGGSVTTIAGTGVAGFADGTPANAQFNYPSGICLDANGTIYIGDQENHRIRKIPSAGMVSTYAGSGISGYLDGAVSIAKFADPCGIDMYNGIIYVADNQNHRIRKISAP